MKQVRLRGGYRIFQQKGGLGLTQDSVLLADFCSLRPGERAIELGCGQGGLWVLTLLKHPGATLDALELDPVSLEQARENAARCGLWERGQFFQGDAAEFRPAGFHYDVCLSNPPYAVPGPPSPESKGCWGKRAGFISAGLPGIFSGRWSFCRKMDFLPDRFALSTENREKKPSWPW